MNVNDMNQLKQNYKNQKMTEKQVIQMKETIENAKKETRKSSSGNIVKFAVPFAAAIALFIAIPNVSMQAAETLSAIPVIGKLVDVVTFRDYKVETETKLADVEVPQIVGNASEETTSEINAEIDALAQKHIEQFKANMEAEGYQELMIDYETIRSNEHYFTIKLTCFEAAASGVEWNYYYTIDLTTGERLALKELFAEGADYITPISENIKVQMAEQMAADENVIYWLDDPDMPEWNFTAITEETQFFLNDAGNIVISFNEGDVAPMYMGICTFEIPAEVVDSIRK